METIVTKMLPDGTIREECWFYNDFTPQYNLLTLWMLTHSLSSSIMDERVRAMHANEIQETTHGFIFWEGDTAYFTRKTQYKKSTNQ